MADSLMLSLKIGATAAGALSALGNTQRAIARLGTGMKELKDHQAQLSAGIERHLGTLAPKTLAALARNYDDLGRSIEKMQHKQTQLLLLQERGQTLRSQRSQMVGQAMETAALGSTALLPVKLAIDFESAMADVKKVVDFADEAGFAKLSGQILGLTRTLPMAAGDLARIAASAGQLGIKEGDIAEFTTTVAKMATAFDMSAEAAGDAMAKLANVYQIPVAQIGRLGDAINQLSNESPARASDIVSTLGRVGGVARSFGLSELQAASLANAFIALGKAPEVAGTAINGMLTKLSTADKQGKKFQEALTLMGVTAAQLKRAIAQDAQGAITDFLQRLQAIPQEQRMGVLVDLFGLEYADDVAVLAGSVGTYTASIAALQKTTADGKAAFAGSMQREFAARAATTANNVQLLKNGLTELGIHVGSVVLPALNGIVDYLRSATAAMADFARANPTLTHTLLGTVAGFAAFKTGALAVSLGVNVLRSGFVALAKAATMLQAGALLVRATFTGGLGLAPALRMLGLNTAQARATAAAYRTATVAAAGFGRTALWAATHPLAALKAATAATLAYASALHTRLAASTRVAMLASVNWARVLGTSLVAGLKAAGAAAWALARAMLMNPIGLAVTAIAAGALLIYRHWSTVKAFFSGLWSGMKAGIHAARSALAPAMAQMRQSWLALKAAIAPLMPVLRLVFAPVIVPLRLVVSGVQTLVGWVRQLFTPTQAAAGAAARLGQSWGAGIGQAIGAIARLVGQALELPARFVQMGADMVGGLVRGIQSQLGAARQAIVDMGLSIKGWFADTLGIRSPSRVFIELGHNVGEGAAIGIARSAQLGVEAAQHMGRQIAAVPLSEADSPLLRPTSSKAVLGRGGGSVQTPDMPLGQKSTGGGALGVK